MGAATTGDRALKGARAERAAAAYVRDQGMTILERNLRVGHLEIDILALDGPVVAIIEVRTRGAGAWQTALASVDGAKRARLRRAGERLWSRRFRAMAEIEHMRFDVAAVDLHTGSEPLVEYVKGAF